MAISSKILLIITLVLSTALLLKFSAHAMREYVTSIVPQLWSTILSWLTPPYLYLVINGIIITIAAFSKFQHKVEEVPDPDPMMPSNDPLGIRLDSEILDVPAYGEAEQGSAISRSDWESDRRDSTELAVLTEKPLLSVRFGKRKGVKAGSEGSKALGEARPKLNETLESTWKAITESRPIPLARQPKKSDTLDTNGHPIFDTLKAQRSSLNSGKPMKPLPREPSPSQDELNRQVEAFIKKFNEQMRLQRQESLEHYKEMVNL